MQLRQGFWQQQPHWYYTDLPGQVFNLYVRASCLGVTVAGIMEGIRVRGSFKCSISGKRVGFLNAMNTSYE